MDRPPTPPAATPAKVIVGETFLTAALKKTTPPANILHPSRIIRLRPPSEGKRTESLTFTRGDGIPLPLPPDTNLAQTKASTVSRPIAGFVPRFLPVDEGSETPSRSDALFRRAVRESR